MCSVYSVDKKDIQTTAFYGNILVNVKHLQYIGTSCVHDQHLNLDMITMIITHRHTDTHHIIQ